MLNQIAIVAIKEWIDGWRDRRAIVSAALYSLMGPGVVGMVSLAVHESFAGHDSCLLYTSRCV